MMKFNAKFISEKVINGYGSPFCYLLLYLKRKKLIWSSTQDCLRSWDGILIKREALEIS